MPAKAPGLPVLVAGLERLRTLGYTRGGLAIRSGYRCPDRNEQLRAQGGIVAKDSQHLFAAAADVDLVVELGAVVDLGAFSGIGWQYVGRVGKRRKLVRHVDVRHASGRNTTGSTQSRPSIWQYGT